MRIGIVTPGFSASEEDWCIPGLLNLVRELSSELQVRVLTLRYPHHHSCYQVYGAKVTPLGGANVRGFRRMGLIRKAIQLVLAEHRRKPFDILHAFWADEPGFVATIAGRLSRTPVVTSVMGGELVAFPQLGYGGQLSRLNRWLTRRALADADLVTVGSNALQRIAAPHVDRTRLVTLPLGVDRSLFHPLNGNCGDRKLLSGDPAMLSVGSLVPIKGQINLIHAFGAIFEEFPQARLHLVGGGPLRTYLERVTLSLGIRERVEFPGEFEHHQLPDIYRSADLVVSPSRFESQGLAPLEAAACGVAVVGTSVGIMPEISDLSQTVRPGDVSGLAAGMHKMLDDQEARRRQIERGLELVNTELNLSRTVERLLGLYRQVLER